MPSTATPSRPPGSSVALGVHCGGVGCPSPMLTGSLSLGKDGQRPLFPGEEQCDEWHGSRVCPSEDLGGDGWASHVSMIPALGLPERRRWVGIKCFGPEVTRLRHRQESCGHEGRAAQPGETRLGSAWGPAATMTLTWMSTLTQSGHRQGVSGNAWRRGLSWSCSSSWPWGCPACRRMLCAGLRCPAPSPPLPVFVCHLMKTRSVNLGLP